MGVAGKLKVAAESCVLFGVAGPVGHENAQPLARAFQSLSRIGRAHGLVETAEEHGAGIGDARDDHVSAVDRVFLVFVEQHGESPVAPGVHPVAQAGVVVVVAHAEGHAVAGLQVGDGAQQAAYAFGLAVGKVAGDENEVRVERVGAAHDFFEPFPCEGGADVQVAQMRDGQAVEILRQTRQGHVHFFDAGHSQGAGHAHGGGRNAGRKHDEFGGHGEQHGEHGVFDAVHVGRKEEDDEGRQQNGVAQQHEPREHHER